MTTEDPDPTQLLIDSVAGGSVADRLFPLVYEELRSIARLRLRNGSGEGLQPTALVHEVYLRLIDQTRIDVTSRNHFLAIAARTLHRVLVDEVRAQRAEKRGGQWKRITLLGDLAGESSGAIDLLALDEALAKLQATHPRRAQVVELRFFGGLSVEEAAGVLGVSARTVSDDWTIARAFLFRELQAVRDE